MPDPSRSPAEGGEGVAASGQTVGPRAELEGEDREGGPADPAEDGALVTSSREHDPPAVVLDEHAVRSLRPFAVVGGELVGADGLDQVLRETQVTGGGGGHVRIT